MGLDGPEADPIAGGRVSKVWRAWHDGRPVALRRSPGFRRLEEVAYECDLLAAFRRAGGPVAAPVAGPLLVGRSAWVAFEWVDGSHPSVPVDDPALYGRLLAELHELAAASADQIAQRPGWGRLDEFFTLPRDGGPLTLEAALPDFEKACGTDGTQLRRLAEDVHERLRAADLDHFPHVVAHGDFGPHQVLLRDDATVGAIVDWDFCHLDLRLADLAIASAHSRPTAERAAQLLQGYLRATDVDIGDLSLLGDLRRAFHLNNLANQVCAVWANGNDVTPQVTAITGRLEREDWWAPTLLAAARAAVRPGPLACTAPVTRHSSDLDVAHELADRAAVVAKHYFDHGVVAETKADATPVTEADRAVERLLRDALADLRPDDAILGEELGRRGTGQRTWILDPIDGTAAFAGGKPDWRIQIALEDGDGITVAVVDAPAHGTRWWATAGGGAYERTGSRTRRLAVSDTPSVVGAAVACHPPAVAQRPPTTVVQPPPTPLPLIQLVRGEVDAFLVDCCHPWDHAPWILLVEEAGGRFTDHLGGRTSSQRGGLYSNSHLHVELLAALDPPITPKSGSDRV